MLYVQDHFQAFLQAAQDLGLKAHQEQLNVAGAEPAEESCHTLRQVEKEYEGGYALVTLTRS